MHRWLGRFVMTLAIVNGGLGLRLAANTKTGMEVYGAVAGVVGVVYIITLVVWYAHQGRQCVK